MVRKERECHEKRITVLVLVQSKVVILADVHRYTGKIQNQISIGMQAACYLLIR